MTTPDLRAALAAYEAARAATSSDPSAVFALADASDRLAEAAAAHVPGVLDERDALLRALRAVVAAWDMPDANQKNLWTTAAMDDAIMGAVRVLDEVGDSPDSKAESTIEPDFAAFGKAAAFIQAWKARQPSDVRKQPREVQARVVADQIAAVPGYVPEVLRARVAAAIEEQIVCHGILVRNVRTEWGTGGSGALVITWTDGSVQQLRWYPNDLAALLSEVTDG